MEPLPTANEWHFDRLEPERRKYLERDPSFESIAERLAADAKVALHRMEPGDKPPVQGCKRPWFKVMVVRELRDLFFNGRDGYRGRYWQSAEAGKRANRHLIDLLTTKLLEKIPSEDEAERDRIVQSLASPSAKLWIYEGKPDPHAKVAKLTVARWPNAWANLAEALEVKGVFLDGNGGEQVMPHKVDRAGQIHRTGWT